MPTDIERISRLETEVGQMKIDIAVAQSDIKKVREDISSIKDDTKWLRRAFTGAIITAGLSIVVAIIVALFRFFITN